MRQPTWPQPETILPRLSVKHLISLLPARLHSICLFLLPWRCFIYSIRLVYRREARFLPSFSCADSLFALLLNFECTRSNHEEACIMQWCSRHFFGGIMERPTFLFGIHCCLIAFRKYQVFIVLLDINTNHVKRFVNEPRNYIKHWRQQPKLLRDREQSSYILLQPHSHGARALTF